MIGGRRDAGESDLVASRTRRRAIGAAQIGRIGGGSGLTEYRQLSARIAQLRRPKQQRLFQQRLWRFGQRGQAREREDGGGKEMLHVNCP